MDAGVLYDFGGLRLRSSIDLPGLTVIPEPGSDRPSPDIHISFSAAPAPAGRPVHQWRGRYRLALEVCDDGWLIRHGEAAGVTVTEAGRALRCYGPDAADLPWLAEIIVRRVLPRVTVFHGRLPMHAATLGDGDGAVMLLGSSGAGKSTMTTALALKLGWKIFSDDVSILGGEGRPMVFPAISGVSVREPARRALALPPEACTALQDREDKVWYSPASGKPSRPQPLEAVILLSFDADGKAIEYQRLDGPKVAVMGSSQLIPFNPRDAGQIAGLVGRWTRMITEVPVYGLVYPRDYAALPDVVETIRRLRTEAFSRPG